MLISSGSFWKWQETKSFPFLIVRFAELPRFEAVEWLETSGGRGEEPEVTPEPEVTVEECTVEEAEEEEQASFG